MVDSSDARSRFMNKIIRDGVDVDVALNAKAKQAEYVVQDDAASQVQRPTEKEKDTGPFRIFKKWAKRKSSRRFLKEIHHKNAELAAGVAATRTEITATCTELAGALKVLAQQQEVIRGLIQIQNPQPLLATISEQLRYRVMKGGVGETIVRTHAGYVVCSDQDYPLITMLAEVGDLEKGTRRLIERFLRPGDVYVDVGANVGMHTLAAARAVGKEGKVFAFEPFEPMVRMLEKSIFMNGFEPRVRVFCAAVSNEKGRHQFYLGKTSGHHSLFPQTESAAGEAADISHIPSVDVFTVRLDDTLPPNQRIDLLKIDAEGAEPEVIQSAENLIKFNQDIAIIMEFGAYHLEKTGCDFEQWFQMLGDQGFVYKNINEETGELEAISVDELKRAFSVNLLWAREHSPVWERLCA